MKYIILPLTFGFLLGALNAFAQTPKRYLVCESYGTKLVIGIKETCAAKRKLFKAMREMRIRGKKKCFWIEK